MSINGIALLPIKFFNCSLLIFSTSAKENLENKMEVRIVGGSDEDPSNRTVKEMGV